MSSPSIKPQLFRLLARVRQRYRNSLLRSCLVPLLRESFQLFWRKKWMLSIQGSQPNGRLYSNRTLKSLSLSQKQQTKDCRRQAKDTRWKSQISRNNIRRTSHQGTLKKIHVCMRSPNNSHMLKSLKKTTWMTTWMSRPSSCAASNNHQQVRA